MPRDRPRTLGEAGVAARKRPRGRSGAGLDPTAIELMLATLSSPHSLVGWAYEIKYDGYRMLAAKRGDSVSLLSRNRKDATSWFPEIIEGLCDVPGDFVIDCEACLLDDAGLPNFEGLRGVARATRRSPANVALFPFDLLSHGEKDCRTLDYLTRKQMLSQLVKDRAERIHFVDYIEGDGLALYREIVKAGLEGVAAKRLDSVYVAGRSIDWLKFRRAITTTVGSECEGLSFARDQRRLMA